MATVCDLGKIIKVKISDANESIEKLMAVESNFDGETKPINQWIDDHRKKTLKNMLLVEFCGCQPAE